MQDLIKRHFWVLGALVVMTCSVFVAKGVNHVVASKYLGDAARAPIVTAIVQATPVAVKATRSKDGAQFAVRNMFCSDCTPAPSTAATMPGDTTAVQMTTLPLVLLATNVSLKSDQSYATVINTENQRQGSYGLGDSIPGAGPLKAIHYKYIDFENGGHLERLVLAGAPPPVVAVADPTPAVPADGDDMTASLNAGIKKIDDTHYEIDKALVDKVLANPMAVAKGARIVPAVKNGKPDGFKLYAIKPSSVYAMLGLTNGDTLESINGFELTSADKALEVYTKLREATSLEISVTRRGKPLAIDYSIR